MTAIDQYKPGPGWTRPGVAPVWDHPSGIRAHLYGMYQVGQVWVDGTEWPESLRLNWYIRVNGGNRKRGVMAWALHHHKGVA